MQLTIQRTEAIVTYEVPFQTPTLLQALYHIKQQIDPSLTFNSNCRSGVCGTCSVRVNGREQLACAYRLTEGDHIEPLRYHAVERDLKVDKSEARATLQQSQAWLQSSHNAAITEQAVKLTEKQSDCILCDSCYSACPVLAVNPNFIGPFALTRVYRYSTDPREADAKPAIDAIQTNGIWDCTLCGECTAVCPQGIDPKMDIMMLRSTSAQFGYSDPNFSSMSFGGFGDFGGFQ